MKICHIEHEQDDHGIWMFFDGAVSEYGLRVGQGPTKGAALTDAEQKLTDALDTARSMLLKQLNDEDR